MKITQIFVSLFLSWTAVDIRRRGDSPYSHETELTLVHDGEQLRQKKQRRYENVIPLWFRGYRPPPPRRCNHTSGKAKDPRYSDQRKIRRRINNL